MSIKELGRFVDEAAEALENHGHRVEGCRAHLSTSGKHPTYAESVTKAVDQELDTESLRLGFDVYAEGISHPDACVSVSYDPLEDAFMVDQLYASSLLDSDEVKLGDIAQTEEREIASDHARDQLKLTPDNDGIFEHDRVEAMVERTLLDEGYDVIIGDAFEDRKRVSKPVSKFP